MALTWFAPVAVLLVGAFVAALLARRLVIASEALRVSSGRTRRIEQALIPVRVETQRARRSIDRHQTR